MIKTTEKYGYYTVNGVVHYSSLLAHLDAIKKNATIKWHYHDDLFASVPRSQLGLFSLDELYRQRAQQLRDSYDYLILNYSGGADSHNILMTFVNNKIKLDQITVRFPFTLINNGLHNPNNIDRSPSNRHSEWDFTIKPTLDILAKTNPEIRIELLDWMDPESFRNIKEDVFHEPRGGWFLGSMLRSPTHTIDKVERELLDKGKKVGILWGIDKPRIWCATGESGDKVYMNLSDKPMVISSPTLSNPNGTEYFYWSPDFPLLAWEMSYQCFLYFNRNPSLRYILTRKKGEKGTSSAIAKWRTYCEVTSEPLYTTWDRNKFQVVKPSFGAPGTNGRPGDVQVESLSEILPFKERWKYLWKSYDELLDRNYPSVLANGELSAVPNNKHHFLGVFS